MRTETGVTGRSREQRRWILPRVAEEAEPPSSERFVPSSPFLRLRLVRRAMSTVPAPLGHVTRECCGRMLDTCTPWSYFMSVEEDHPRSSLHVRK